MKKISRFLILLLALVMAASCYAFADEITDQDPVLFTLNGEEVTVSMVDEEIVYLMNQGYLTDFDYETAIQEAMIPQMLILNQIKKMGMDQFTDEEIEAFHIDAQNQWDAAIEQNMIYFLSEDTEEGRKLAKEAVAAAFLSEGIDLDMVFNELKQAAMYDRFYNAMFAEADIAVTEAEVKAIFDACVAQDRDLYENNVMNYEISTMYYGNPSWYMPEGFRGITHILLDVDEELLNAFVDAQAAQEEEVGQVGEKADADAAMQAILDSRKEEIDAIYDALANGDSFEGLIALYGTDPGMMDETNLKNGYSVHRDSVIWDPAFISGSFSDKMVKPGDVSDPVVGSYGIHILYYLRDIPSGAVELSDEIYSEIEAYLQNDKMTEIYNAALAEWKAEAEIVYNEDAIAAAYANVTE